MNKKVNKMDLENSNPITIKERQKWEATQNFPISIKICNSAADIFTPVEIKFLSNPGRKNMGIYGIYALIFLITMVGLNLYGLIKSGEDRPLVLINLLLPSFIFIISTEKFISGLLNSFIKKFQ